MREVGQALSPAKINLGLQILNRRDDGYHDIETIMQTVSVCDRLFMTWPGTGQVFCDDPQIPSDQNLIARAIRHLSQSTNRPLDVDFRLEKRIPIAAGLAGGSSNAATALRLLARFWNLDERDKSVLEAAAATGSDVPFFLYGGLARATGRGDRIETIAAAKRFSWVLIAVPNISIEGKTAKLYRSLTVADFTPSPDPGLPLHNAFQRPLYDNFPSVARVYSELRLLTDTPVALSGAGPAHYLLLEDLDRAVRLLYTAQANANLSGCRFFLARPMHGTSPLRMLRNDRQAAIVCESDVQTLPVRG